MRRSLAPFFLLAFAIQAQAHSLSVEVYDRYVWNGELAYDGPVVQTDLAIDLRDGLYIDLWWSTGLDDGDLNRDGGDELDYEVGWAGSVDVFDINAGLVYFDTVELLSSEGGDAVQPFLEIGRTWDVSDSHALLPYARVEYHIPVGDWEESTPDGVYGFIGLVHDWAVIERASLSSEVLLMVDSGAYGNDEAIIAALNVSLDWSLFNDITLILPKVALSAPINDVSDEREAERALGGGVAYEF